MIKQQCRRLLVAENPWYVVCVGGKERTRCAAMCEVICGVRLCHVPEWQASSFQLSNRPSSQGQYVCIHTHTHTFVSLFVFKKGPKIEMKGTNFRGNVKTRQSRNTAWHDKGKMVMRYGKGNWTFKCKAYFSYFKGVRRQALIHYKWEGNGTKGANIKNENYYYVRNREE